MEARVKWFSREKGYGFLVDSAGVDRFFGVRSVKDLDLPDIGDTVAFDPYLAKKGPAAKNITLISKSERTNNSNKLDCPECKRSVFPRLVTYAGNPDKSLCPICGAIIKDFVNPFIRFLRLF